MEQFYLIVRTIEDGLHPPKSKQLYAAHYKLFCSPVSAGLETQTTPARLIGSISEEIVTGFIYSYEPALFGFYLWGVSFQLLRKLGLVANVVFGPIVQRNSVLRVWRSLVVALLQKRADALTLYVTRALTNFIPFVTQSLPRLMATPTPPVSIN